MKQIVTLCVLTVMAGSASADLIEFNHESETAVTGTLDGEPFVATFIITALGDTDDRDMRTDVFWIDHNSASIEIEGLGAFDFVTPTRTFVNNQAEAVGFSRAGRNGVDLFDGPFHPDFAAWDMFTSIGPISGDDAFTFAWREDPLIETTGGILIIEDQELINAVFTATIIPAPAAFALFGLAAFASKRARRINK